VNREISLEVRAMNSEIWPMGLVDTHTHLESFVRRDDLAAALSRAREAGVDEMITIGTSPEDWALYRELAGTNPKRVHYSVGLHPCAVDEKWETAIAGLEAFWAEAPDSSRLENKEAGTLDNRVAHRRPVALGEIGLDRFHLPKNDTAAAEKIFAWQRAALAEGLGIARRLNCPVVVHSRGAFAECVEMIDSSGVDWSKVVFHCFTEGELEMVELTRRGGWGSFTGIITYKSAENVRAAAKAQGLDRLMIETDAPYLTPMPHRGKPNEPAFLRHTAEYCAREVFGVSVDVLAETTTANARRFFGI
jgi:TatD DNase family protein